jgi:hypothetical protein
MYEIRVFGMAQRIVIGYIIGYIMSTYPKIPKVHNTSLLRACFVALANREFVSRVFT